MRRASVLWKDFCELTGRQAAALQGLPKDQEDPTAFGRSKEGVASHDHSILVRTRLSHLISPPLLLSPPLRSRSYNTSVHSRFALTLLRACLTMFDSHLHGSRPSGHGGNWRFPRHSQPLLRFAQDCGSDDDSCWSACRRFSRSASVWATA